MRCLLSAAFAAFFLLSIPAYAACSDTGITVPPTELILYKNTWTPMQGLATPEWLEFGHAYTAQTIYIPFDRLKIGGAKFNCVTATIVMQALSPSAYVGVGLFVLPAQSDAAEAQLDQAAVFWSFASMNDSAFAPWSIPCSGSGSGPHPCRVDWTDAFNALINGGTAANGNTDGNGNPILVTLPGGVPYYVTIGAYGNGTNGPYIYGAWLDID